MTHHDRAMSFGKALLFVIGGGLYVSAVCGTTIPLFVLSACAFFGLVFFNALESHGD